jgi:hypothetical protein
MYYILYECEVDVTTIQWRIQEFFFRGRGLINYKKKI